MCCGLRQSRKAAIDRLALRIDPRQAESAVESRDGQQHSAAFASRAPQGGRDLADARERLPQVVVSRQRRGQQDQAAERRADTLAPQGAAKGSRRGRKPRLAESLFDQRRRGRRHRRSPRFGDRVEVTSGHEDSTDPAASFATRCVPVRSWRFDLRRSDGLRRLFAAPLLRKAAMS